MSALLAVLTSTQAIVVAIIIVVLVILAWKFLKFAFKIAVLVAAAVLLFLVLRNSGVL